MALDDGQRNPETPNDNNPHPAAQDQQQQSSSAWHSITRRNFVVGASLATAGWAACGKFASTDVVEAAAPADAAAELVTVDLTINGTRRKLSLDPRVTLLDLLRENLGLTGTKKGCDHGQCGACTVLSNGRRINSCLSLAVVHHGEEITTIEGLAQGDQLHPVQEAFIENDGFQCGYCTPGQICSAVALLQEADRGDASQVTANLKHSGKIELTADEIRERMSGNICRCGAYPGIVHAVQSASQHRS